VTRKVGRVTDSLFFIALDEGPVIGYLKVNMNDAQTEVNLFHKNQYK
jgi:hypothetical protein